jgi:hypothetical protein
MIQKYNGQVRQQISELLQKCSMDDIELIVQDIKRRRTYLHRLAVRSFKRGQKVQFFNRGSYIQGTIEKVAEKYITLNTGTDRWRVPAGHLEKVA